MEISTEKSKVMVNSNATTIHANITLYGNNREEVNKLCYLGAPSQKIDLVKQKLR